MILRILILLFFYLSIIIVVLEVFKIDAFTSGSLDPPGIVFRDVIMDRFERIEILDVKIVFFRVFDEIVDFEFIFGLEIVIDGKNFQFFLLQIVFANQIKFFFGVFHGIEP